MYRSVVNQFLFVLSEVVEKDKKPVLVVRIQDQNVASCNA